MPRIALTLVEPVLGTSTKMHLYLCEITRFAVSFFYCRSKTVAVKFDLSGKGLFDDSPLVLVEDLLIRCVISAVLRLRSHAEVTFETNVDLGEHLRKIPHQVLIAHNPVNDNSRAGGIRIPEIVNWKPASCEILIERERPACPGGCHIIMGQHLVPRIPFHAELKVLVPGPRWNTLLNEPCRHMIVEFFASLESMPQGMAQPLRPPEQLGDRIDDLFVIARLMPLDRRSDRRYNVAGSALLGEEDLNACARSFCRLDEDEFMFVRNDHRPNRMGRWLDAGGKWRNRKMDRCIARRDPGQNVLPGRALPNRQTELMQRRWSGLIVLMT